MGFSDGVAPLRNSKNEVVGIVGVDLNVNDYMQRMMGCGWRGAAVAGRGGRAWERCWMHGLENPEEVANGMSTEKGTGFFREGVAGGPTGS